MVVTTITIEAGILDANIEPAGQAEGHERFRRQIHRLPLCDDLSPGSRPCANGRADRGALAAAGDRTDDGAKQRPSTDVRRGVFVRTDRACSGTQLTCGPNRTLIRPYGIPLTTDGHRFEI